MENKNRSLEYNVMSVRHLEEELRGYKEDISGHEAMIRNVSAEPFMRQENGISIKSRIADLENRLQERQREGQSLETEGGSLKNEVAALTKERDSIMAKRDLLHDQHSASVKDYNDRTGGAGLN